MDNRGVLQYYHGFESKWCYGIKNITILLIDVKYDWIIGICIAFITRV